MHICFVTKEYSAGNRPHGGIGRKLRLIAEALVNRGHKITVTGFPKKPQKINQNGVLIDELNSSTKGGLRGLLENRKTLRAKLREINSKNQIDLIEIPESSGAIFPFRLGIPVVVRCSCSHAYFASELGYRPRYHIAILEAIALHSATKVSACSNYVARRTESIFRLKRDSIETLYNPVDINLFTPLSDSEIEKGLIVFIGSLFEKKGVLELAEAFNKVVEKNNTAQLVYIGRDTKVKSTEGSAKEMIISRLSTAAVKRTIFEGHIGSGEVRDYLQKAEVFILPSKVEGHSNAIIEAQASGKAIVVGNHGSSLEIVNDGVDGFVVDPNNPNEISSRILELLGNDTLRNEFGKQAREVATSNFAIEIMVKKNEAFFERVISNSKK